jgi:hypothetical protein
LPNPIIATLQKLNPLAAIGRSARAAFVGGVAHRQEASQNLMTQHFGTALFNEVRHPKIHFRAIA